MAWFSREEVRLQLAALGYKNISDSTLEDFYIDLVVMAKEDDEAKELEGQAGPAAPLPDASPQLHAATMGIESDKNFDKIVTESPGDYIVGMFDQLEQMALLQRTKAEIQAELDATPALPTAHILDPTEDHDLEDNTVGGNNIFDEVLADPKYVAPAFIPKRAPKKKRNEDVVSRGRRYREEQRRFHIPGQNRHSKLRHRVHKDVREVAELPLGRPNHRHQKNTYVVPTDKKRQALRWVVREYTEHAR
mmetsp:Transcript_33350/g.87469  ORF Transcript_33350/g.87469 Transcript_33350/m.87469 type:complete len:248 (-) Transcript_33350:1189-1932(-)